MDQLFFNFSHMKILLLTIIGPAIFFLGNLNNPYPYPNPVDSIVTGLKQWRDNYPQEKVFVQTDREKYAAGETIWFKGWAGLDNKPTFLSRILYVVLSDSKGNVIEKKMCQLGESAAANGNFDLDRKLKSGNYIVSGYTLWMLNFPEFVFKKNIYIYGNDYKQKSAVNASNNNQFDFFPEGGEIIESVNGRIGFKAVNGYGFPVGCKGGVYSSDGTKLIDFQSQHDGMGVFELEVAAGKSYTAKVSFDNGKIGEYRLPVARKEGVALQVFNNPSRIAISLNRGLVNSEKYNKVFAVAHINGQPVYRADFNIAEGEVGASIPKKNLPAGIMQITVFDSTGMPLSERLVFVDNHQVIKPDVKVGSLNTGKRGHNQWSFRLDTLDAPGLSVIVVNASSDTKMNTKENLASSFLVTSDIKGYVHNAGYYFSNKDASTLQNLDLVMLTHGWRRFTWKQILSQESIALKHPVETFINIKGKVTKSGRPDPVKEGFASFIIRGEDSTTILSNAMLTDKGEFMVDSLQFRGKAKLSYDGTNNKRAAIPVDITLYPSFIDTLKRNSWLPAIDLDTALLKNEKTTLSQHLQDQLPLPDSTDPTVLGNVTVKAKKISKADSLQKEYVSPLYEMSDQTLVLPDGQNFLNIWQFLNANVPGFNVNPFQPGGVTYASFSRYDGLSLTDTDQAIKFILNEMPVSIDVIDGLHPNDIALVKVYKGALGFSFGAESGAISVYTKKGVGAGKSVYDKSFITTDKLGFAVTREFYHPNYRKYPELNKNAKDNRIILYWDPEIKPNSAGDYIIEFDNDDSTSAFKLTIQGMDRKGRMVYKEQILQ